MFKQGESVIIKKFEDMPEEYRSSGIAKICGKRAEIKYAATSDNGDRIYLIQVDGATSMSSLVFNEDMLAPISMNIRFSVEYVPEEKIIEAHMYDGDEELGMGFGRVDGNTLESIAQAASYAMKRLWLNIDPDFFKEEER